MSLFQQSVLNKYLKEANQEEMEAAYRRLTIHFHNPHIQQNIRESKEEQYQEGFLRELLVNVFGYVINPFPNYNLTTEFKNERGAKKADGAILKDGAAIAVIELKSTKTKDLESIRLQAFDYKANQSKCVYVITSNFEKVRFYINNAVDYEEFDLFKLTYEDFQLLWLCVAKENLLNGIPLAIKEASILKEANITKQIYVDYSLFKSDLYNDLIQNNLELEIFKGLEEKEIKLQLFKKSQKLLDRFLFIFFGEDRGLLPPNSISKIIDKWKYDTEWGDSKSLYSIFKVYFNFLNKGRPARGERAEIFAYNGGLFIPDEVLDNIVISDELLKNHTAKLTAFDFETDVDVNILGHIFENSLNEIEEITAQIEGAEVDLKKSKRKKDGVFYTPKYITKYIVENTVGKLCDEKKTELEIEESEYLKSRKGRTKKKLKELVEKLDTYRNWLLTLTICDPACGSGAFLNQALDFLINEHHYIDEIKAKLLDVPMIFTEVENSILENNIFGVDINEESVEIAKLSLWLRTAQKGRKLTTLSNNIKCGNSLIDNPEIAGDKAFNWQNEFPEVFKNGGFDAILGNPPYGILIDEDEEKHYKTHFPLTNYKINLYILFIERMFQIYNSGIVHFIIPKSLLFNTYFENLRRHLLEKSKIHEIFMLTEKVFEDAEVGGSLIIKFEINDKNNSKEKLKLISANTYFNFEEKKCLINNIEQEFFLNVPNCEISPISKGVNSIIKKLHKLKPIKEHYKLKNGLNPGNIKHVLIDKSKLSDNHKPIIWGKEFVNYIIKWGGDYINYDVNIAKSLTLDDIKSKEGMKKQTKIDFALRTSNLFECTKLIVRKTGDRFIAAKDENNLYFDTLVHGIYQLSPEFDLDFILAVLNSKPATTFYRLLHDIKGKVFAKISLDKLASFPMPTGTIQLRKNLSDKSIETSSSKSIQENISRKFLKYIQSQYSINITSKKLQNWHELDFANFIKELNKAIKKAGGEKLSKMDEMEWMEVFEAKKAEAQNLKAEIDKTDREIDKMVYELYGLSDEEIKIVEGAV